MKKFFLFIILLCAWTFSVAQISGGPKAGLNVANFLGENLKGYNYKLGFHAGGFFNYAFTDVFSIQGEVVFSQKGSTFKYSYIPPPPSAPNNTETKGSYTLNYIDFPILFQLTLSTGSYVYAGPMISSLATLNYKYETTTTTVGLPKPTVISVESGDKEGFSTTDFGIAGGTGYQSDRGFNFCLRANLGFNGITESGEPVMKNICFQISLGYAFAYAAKLGKGRQYDRRKR
ncbi:MAG: porin family protein [Bacteroidota bacterium]